MFGQPEVDSPLCWLMAFSALVINGVIIGVTYSFGIFYVAILQEFPGTESESAWIMSINMGVLMLSSPFTIFLCRQLTPRVVTCFGLLFAGLALYLASMATNITTLYMTFGLMHGLATSFCYVSPLLVLRTNFKRFLNLACGLSGAGVGIGSSLFSFAMPGMIEAYSWRGALRVCAYVTLAVTVFGTVLVQRKEHGYEVTTKGEKTAKREKTTLLPRRKSLLKAAKLSDSSPWRNKAYIFLNICFLLAAFVTAIPYCHIVNFAIKQGLSKAHASTLSMYLCIGSTVGRTFTGKFVGLFGMTRLFLTQMVFLVLAVTMSLCSLATTFGALITFACVVGAMDGAFNILLAVVVDDVFTDKKQALKALGHLFAMLCFPYFFGSPLAGWLYQATQSYHTVFYTCGAMYFIASCLMSAVRCLQPQQYTNEVITFKLNDNDVKGSAQSLIPTCIASEPVQNRLIRSKTCSILDLPVELYLRGEESSRHLAVPQDNRLLLPSDVNVINNMTRANSSNFLQSDSMDMKHQYSCRPDDEYTDISGQISGFFSGIFNMKNFSGSKTILGGSYNRDVLIGDEITHNDVSKHDVMDNVEHKIEIIIDNDANDSDGTKAYDDVICNDVMMHGVVISNKHRCDDDIKDDAIRNDGVAAHDDITNCNVIDEIEHNVQDITIDDDVTVDSGDVICVADTCYDRINQKNNAAPECVSPQRSSSDSFCKGVTGERDDGYISCASNMTQYSSSDSDHSCSIQSAAADSIYGSLDEIPDIITDELSPKFTGTPCVVVDVKPDL